MNADKIIFFNQAGGRLFRELVAASVKQFKEVRYIGSIDEDCLQNVHITRTPRHTNRGVIGRLASWFMFLLISAYRILKEPGKPVLFITTNPPIAPVLGLFARSLKGLRYVLLYYDAYPEALTFFTGLSPRSVVARAWRLANRAAIRNASGVLTISPQIAEVLTQYQDAARPPLRVLPTWVNTEFIRPIPKSENWFAKKHGQLGKLTILYSGNIGVVHDLSMLPELACRLRGFPDISFLVIGEGPGKSALQKECARRGLGNVRFLPFQDDSTIPFSLSTGDIGIISIAAGAEGISMPSKTYYLMSAGNAIMGICSPQSHLATVISESQCGVHVAPGCVDEAARIILELRDRPQILNQYRERARTAAEERFSAAICIPNVLKFLAESFQ